MHAAYIEGESRLKRHRGPGLGSPLGNRIETRTTISLARPRAHGEEGRERQRERERGVREPWPRLKLVLSGRGSPPKDRKVDFIKRIYGSIVLTGRIRAAGTAF